MSLSFSNFYAMESSLILFKFCCLITHWFLTRMHILTNRFCGAAIAVFFALELMLSVMVVHWFCTTIPFNSPSFSIFHPCLSVSSGILLNSTLHFSQVRCNGLHKERRNTQGNSQRSLLHCISLFMSQVSITVFIASFIFFFVVLIVLFLGNF